MSWLVPQIQTCDFSGISKLNPSETDRTVMDFSHLQMFENAIQLPELQDKAAPFESGNCGEANDQWQWENT